MEVYLKGYYGYKNLGDEILLFGVIRQLKKRRKVTKILLEVEDVTWTQEWLGKHSSYTEGVDILCVPKPGPVRQCVNMLKSLLGLFPFLVLGGGEVINTIHSFPHNGRNYLLMYAGNVLRGNYIIRGGVTIRHEKDPIASVLCKRAKEVLVRDTGSFENATNFHKDVILFQDFAINIVQEERKNISQESGFKSMGQDQKEKKKPYILCNLHPSRLTKEDIARVVDYCQQHDGKDCYFVPCDMALDDKGFSLLKKEIPGLLFYDWTKHDMNAIISFFSESDGGIGARLHFLLLLKECERPFEPIVYHEKVQKVLKLEEENE